MPCDRQAQKIGDKIYLQNLFLELYKHLPKSLLFVGVLALKTSLTGACKKLESIV